MKPLVLAINAGSSSLKFAVHEGVGAYRRVDGGKLEGIGTEQASIRIDGASERFPASFSDPAQALAWLLRHLEQHHETSALVAAGHRVVHGGLNYATPVRVDPKTRQELGELIPLAPLHQGHNLEAIDALARLRPELPQVACFDTAFHRQQPELAQRYALPRRLHDAGVRAYGFHGLSYEYIARRLPEVCGELPGRVIVAHLGSGASLCALENGRSVATTMGMTPLDGIPMGTRPGHLDPGVLLYLQQQMGLVADQLEDMLYHHSGLLGVSGISGDMQTLLQSDADAARESIELFVYQIGRHIGSLAAALGGLDALVFTGGIGEGSMEIRRLVCQRAAWLGVDCDEAANRQGCGAIHSNSSQVSAWVIPTDEAWMITHHTLATLSA